MFIPTETVAIVLQKTKVYLRAPEMGGFLSHQGCPSDHPFFDGFSRHVFPCKTLEPSTRCRSSRAAERRLSNSGSRLGINRSICSWTELSGSQFRLGPSRRSCRTYFFLVYMYYISICIYTYIYIFICIYIYNHLLYVKNHIYHSWTKLMSKIHGSAAAVLDGSIHGKFHGKHAMLNRCNIKS